MTKKNMALGPDISTFNGKVDFDKLKNEVDFVIIRCGYGSNYEFQDDERFKRNADECDRSRSYDGMDGKGGERYACTIGLEYSHQRNEKLFEWDGTEDHFSVGFSR